MPRILNKEKYPLKTTPVDDDFVIGTDSENNDNTVSFSVGSIKGTGGTTVDQNNKIRVVDLTFFFNEPTDQQVVDAINALTTPLVVAEDENIVFRVFTNTAT